MPMTFRLIRFGATALAASGLLMACSSAPPPATAPTAAAQAAAAPAGPPPVVHINTALETCRHPLGSVVVSEDTGSIWYSQMRDYRLPPASTVLRVLVQQSGCFTWLAPGNHPSRKGASTPHADFILSPSISFDDTHPDNTAVTLSLQDSHSTVQLAQTEGSARYVDFQRYSPMFGAPQAGTGAFVKSTEGRIVAAAFVDAYNLLVRAARPYQSPDIKSSLPELNLPDLPNKPSLPNAPSKPPIALPDRSALDKLR